MFIERHILIGFAKDLDAWNLVQILSISIPATFMAQFAPKDTETIVFGLVSIFMTFVLIVCKAARNAYARRQMFLFRREQVDFELPRIVESEPLGTLVFERLGELEEMRNI